MEEEKKKEETLYHELNMPLYEALKEHRAEYKRDTTFSRVDIGDVAMKVPAIKAKWVARHDEYKNAKADAEKQFAKELKAAVAKVRKESKIDLTKIAAEKKAMEEIQILEVLKERIELLDRLESQSWEIVEKHLKYFNSEVQTIIDTIKLETM
jgi:hypothetical protein